MVHYIQPYSTAKNIGGAINLAISNLICYDDDWIVLLDHDVMFLRPDSKFQLEETLLSKNCSHDIIGCMTNRLGVSDQFFSSMFWEENIINHVQVANNCHQQCYGLVRNTNGVIAAMLMCFKVRTWKKLLGFDENSIKFDSLFCRRAKHYGLKLGILTGLYVFHLYRMGMPGEARNNYKHLLP